MLIQIRRQIIHLRLTKDISNECMTEREHQLGLSIRYYMQYESDALWWPIFLLQQKKPEMKMTWKFLWWYAFCDPWSKHNQTNSTKTDFKYYINYEWLAIQHLSYWKPFPAVPWDETTQIPSINHKSRKLQFQMPLLNKTKHNNNATRSFKYRHSKEHPEHGVVVYLFILKVDAKSLIIRIISLFKALKNGNKGKTSMLI